MTKIRSQQYNDFAQVDQPVPNAVELGGIDSGTLDPPEAGNKALFLDQVDNEVKTIDPNGVIETLGGDGGGGGGLGLEFIDETTSFPYTLIKDRGTRCDFSQVVGPTEIELILPEGTGAETFRCGVTITSLPEDVTVKISTSNAQTILLPDGSTTEFIENINAATEFVIAWDQSQYNYGDDWAPNYANFTGNVPFDEITVNKINGGEATATQAGTVEYEEISISGTPTNVQSGTFTITGARVNKNVNLTIYYNFTANGNGEVILGTLPESFRPNTISSVINFRVNQTTDSTRIDGFLQISNSGQIKLYPSLSGITWSNNQSAGSGFNGTQDLAINYCTLGI